MAFLMVCVLKQSADGPTQLVKGIVPATFYKGPIPKGCLTPVCGMNLAFKIEALPWVYFAPMGKTLGIQRFSDIWMGVHLKWDMDIMNKAIVTGYSTVEHLRASNVFTNLEQEARGIRMNEDWWKEHKPPEDEYWDLYASLRIKWHDLITSMLKENRSGT